MAKKTSQPSQLSWVAALPEIIETLRARLGGVETFDAAGTVEEAWAQRSKELDVGQLRITEEGRPQSGPYRLTLCAMSGESPGDLAYDNSDEPLLKLEIRPSPLWINEVKRLGAEFPKKAEPVAAV
jgi:hypothetical protein